MFWITVTLGSVLEVIGDYYLKKWSLTQHWSMFAWGLLFYFGGSSFWAWALRYENLSRAIGIFFVVNVLIAVGVGVILFGESLSRVHWIGIGFGVLSILLLSTKA